MKRNFRKLGALVSVVLGLSAVAYAQSSVCVPDTLAPPEGCIESRYDRFENKTTVTVQMRVAGADKGERLYLAVLGQQANTSTPPAFVTIIINAYAVEGYPFTGECALNIIADQQRFRLELAKVTEEQVATYSYAQGFGGRLAFSEFKKVVGADDVEMRFCSTEFKLTPAQLARMREFVKRF